MTAMRRMAMTVVAVLALVAMGCGSAESVDSADRATTSTSEASSTTTNTSAATTEPQPTSTSSASAASWDGPDVDDGRLVYVPLGNSLTFLPVGWSVNDHFADILAQESGVPVEMRSYHTVGGQRADHFLDRLVSDETLRRDLAHAHVITFLVPNDEWAEPSMTAVGLDGRDPVECGGDDNQQCLRNMISDYNALVDEIFEELMTIVDLNEQVVRVQDFFLFHTEGPLKDSELLYPYWAEGQAHVRKVAEKHGVPVARVWDDFMGNDGQIPNLVELGLVHPDGIHVTSEGAKRVAELYHDLGYELGAHKSELEEQAVGLWVTDRFGVYNVFNEDGTYGVGHTALSAAGSEFVQPEMEWGQWSFDGNVLTLDTDPDSRYCAAITATYEIALSDDGQRLLVTLLEDDCQSRARDFGSSLTRHAG